MLNYLINNYITIILLVGAVTLFANYSKIGHKNLSFFKLLILYIVLLIAVTDIENYFGNLDHVTIYRYIFSILGYTLRPLIVLTFILTTIDITRKQRINLHIPIIITFLIYSTSFFSPVSFRFGPNNNFIRSNKMSC